MNIYVGNVSLATTEYQLRKAFEMYGRVDKISLQGKACDSDAYGFCFVEMPFEKQATLAIQKLNGLSLGGQVVTVRASGVSA